MSADTPAPLLGQNRDGRCGVCDSPIVVRDGKALSVIDRSFVEERDGLRRAIVEHRTAIHNAGFVRVDSRDIPAADAKHAADQRLWAVLSAL